MADADATLWPASIHSAFEAALKGVQRAPAHCYPSGRHHLASTVLVCGMIALLLAPPAVRVCVCALRAVLCGYAAGCHATANPKVQGEPSSERWRRIAAQVDGKDATACQQYFQLVRQRIMQQRSASNSGGDGEGQDGRRARGGRGRGRGSGRGGGGGDGQGGPPAGGVGSRWWERIGDSDPISLEPLAELPYPPFELRNEAFKVGRGGGGGGGGSNEVLSTWFDGRILAHYLVSTGKFLHPITRRELTAAECTQLDGYLAQNRLGRGRVAEAYARRSEYVPDPSTGRLGTMGLQAEATALLHALFTRAETAPEPLVEAAAAAAESRRQRLGQPRPQQRGGRGGRGGGRGAAMAALGAHRSAAAAAAGGAAPRRGRGRGSAQAAAAAAADAADGADSGATFGDHGQNGSLGVGLQNGGLTLRTEDDEEQEVGVHAANGASGRNAAAQRQSRGGRRASAAGGSAGAAGVGSGSGVWCPVCTYENPRCEPAAGSGRPEPQWCKMCGEELVVAAPEEEEEEEEEEAYARQPSSSEEGRKGRGAGKRGEEDDVFGKVSRRGQSDARLFRGPKAVYGSVPSRQPTLVSAAGASVSAVRGGGAQQGGEGEGDFPTLRGGGGGGGGGTAGCGGTQRSGASPTGQPPADKS
eukprot:COSAG01_NODE_60_length_29981_cov_23.262533_19_plen_643_part_00